MSAKRDCLFYEEYRDMGASMDLCTVQDIIGCHCDDCRDYFSINRFRQFYRLAIAKERREKEIDTNETI